MVLNVLSSHLTSLKYAYSNGFVLTVTNYAGLYIQILCNVSFGYRRYLKHAPKQNDLTTKIEIKVQIKV